MFLKIDWAGWVSEAEYLCDPLHGDIVVTLSRGSGGHSKITGQAPPRRSRRRIQAPHSSITWYTVADPASDGRLFLTDARA